MSLGRVLSKLQSGLPLVNAPELAASVHWTPSQDFPIHRWFRYREGFSPDLLKNFRGSVNRFDPFCGCGTTLLESVRQEVPSAGVDLNPLATFVARAKTRTYSSADRSAFAKHAKEALRTYRGIPGRTIPPFPLLAKLFLPASLSILMRFRTYIETISGKKVRDLLSLAWLSILEDCSNVFKEGNGLKYRNKQRQPGRYVTVPNKVWIPKYFGPSVRHFVETAWSSKCQEILADLGNEALPAGFEPRIETGSCLAAGSLPDDNSVDLAIFSPPYANRFDYFEAFKIELWLGGFVRSNRDMLSLRRRGLRSNLAAERFRGDKWDRLDPFLNLMDESASSVRMGIKGALQGYFYDLRLLLRSLDRAVRPRGRVVTVVGNSAYAKVIIPTDALFARLAQEEGFRVSGIHVARHLHVSSQQRAHLVHHQDFMRESIVILERLR